MFTIWEHPLRLAAPLGYNNSDFMNWEKIYDLALLPSGLEAGALAATWSRVWEGTGLEIF